MSSYKRPPLLPNEESKRYDSCVDKQSDPNLFVVFEPAQAYPEYLIEYKVQ